MLPCLTPRAIYIVVNLDEMFSMATLYNKRTHKYILPQIEKTLTFNTYLKMERTV